jgi:hypothetical protein
MGMLYQRVDRYADLSYESYESYNIYIYTIHYILYIGGEESTQRGERTSAAFSAAGLEKAARSVLPKTWLLLASWRASAAPQTVPAVGTAPLSYFAAPRGFAAKKAE